MTVANVVVSRQRVSSLGESNFDAGVVEKPGDLSALGVSANRVFVSSLFEGELSVFLDGGIVFMMVARWELTSPFGLYACPKVQ